MARKPLYAPQPSEEDLNQARAVFERTYMGWVVDLATELVFEAFNEDITDDELEDRRRERTDSGSGGLVYTADQWVCLQASRSTDAALEEMRELGMGTTENLVAVWSTLAYGIDVREAMSEDLLQPLQEGLGLEERLLWLVEEHGKKTVKLDGGQATIIGDVDGVSFGILITDGKAAEPQFVGRSLDAEDGALLALLDVMLEEGGYGEASKRFVRGTR